MLEILQKLLIGLFGCALIFFPITYRMMDKIRFHCQMCIRQMDDGLLCWIETASALVSLDESNSGKISEYTLITQTYRETRAGKTEEKVRLANDAYEMVRKASIGCYGDPRARALHEKLAEIYSDISILADDYNENAKKLNEQLEGGFSGFLGKVFFFRKQPLLEDLTALK